jgi:hypothetical protein
MLKKKRNFLLLRGNLPQPSMAKVVSDYIDRRKKRGESQQLIS